MLLLTICFLVENTETNFTKTNIRINPRLLLDLISTAAILSVQPTPEGPEHPEEVPCVHGQVVPDPQEDIILIRGHRCPLDG